MSEDASNYRLGDWLIEPARNRLSKGDESQRLEAKAIDVLVCLIEHAGEVVPTETLLAEVWPGRIVEQSTAHRRINQIRKVLGDDPRAPEYIETIPKRGYRLIAPMLAATEPTSPATRAPITKAPAYLPQNLASGRFVVLVGISALLLVVASGLGAWLFRADLWPQAPAYAPRSPPTIAIQDFLPIDDESTAWARTVTQDIRSEIGQTSLQHVTSESRADYVLSGSTRRTAAGSITTVELRSTADGRIEWTKRLDDPERDDSQFARATFVARMIESLGGPLRLRDSTFSAPTIEAFLAGLTEVYEFNLGAGGSWRAAETHFKRVLQLDPDFWQAHFMLAIGYSNRLGGELRADQAIPLAHQHVQAGLAHDPHQTRVLGQINLFLELDYPAARLNLEHARRFPSPLNQVGGLFCLLSMIEGRLNESRRQCRSQLALGAKSDQANVLRSLAKLSFLEGRYAEALDYLKEQRQTEAFESSDTLRERARTQFLAGNTRQGDETLDALLSIRDVRPEDHVDVLALAGRRELTERALVTAEQRFARHELVNHSVVFRALYHLGDRDRAFVWLNRAIDNREWWLIMELRSAVYLEDLRTDRRFESAMRRLAKIEAQGSRTVSEAMR